MKAIKLGYSGFTLIELITAIVIVAILSVIAGMGLVQIANGFVFAKKNAIASQQGQIALTRLAKEFSAIQSISSATATSITYTRTPGETHTVSWTTENQPVTIDGDTLIGNVKSFSLTYYSTYNASGSPYSATTPVIEIALEIKGYMDTTLRFVDRVVI